MFKCVNVGESMWPQAPKASDPLELELHVNVSSYTWILRMELSPLEDSIIYSKTLSHLSSLFH